MNKIQNSYDGWAHVHQTQGYKKFYCVAIHDFEGDVEELISFQHMSDAVDYSRKWNDGIIGEKQG